MLKKIIAIAALVWAGAAAAVDANTATVADLDGVKGIGPATSRLILAERKHGPFRSWDDFIARVKGIGDARAASLSANGLTVANAPYPGAAGTAGGSDSAAAGARPAIDTAATVEKTKEIGRKVADKAEEVAKKTGQKLSGK